jgi:REP element-mobilizing transposase RayT
MTFAPTPKNRYSRDVTEPRPFEGAATTYLITWACYGAWFPGQTGAITRTQNQFGAPLPLPDARKEQQSRKLTTQEPYLLGVTQRQVVLNSVQEVCFFHGWSLLAAHVRSNHVHVVTTANCRPERVMNALKAYSSRALNRFALDGPDRRRLARHGSTQYLWTDVAIATAVQYVVREQGEPMTVFEIAPR